MPAMLILAALIPRDAIKEKSLKSAQYMFEHEQFECMIDGVEGSRLDRYADSILLNIAYNLDSEYPIKSVMLSAYYFTPDHEENENYLISVRDDTGINRQYLRYWHGSIALVRPLLAVVSVCGIYVVNACIIVILFAVYAVLLVRIKEYVPLVAMAIALVMTRVWFVPMCLEYTWMIMLMLICSIATVVMHKKEMDGCYDLLFILSGMTTAFFDFLTTETLTLLVPLLLILWFMQYRDVSPKDKILLPLKYAICWGVSYVAMWASKWLLTSVVMKENALPYVLEHVEERIGGDLGLGLGQYITGALIRNIGCLFPLGYGAIGVIAFIAVIIYAFYRAYVYRGNAVDKRLILVMTLAGLVPFVRYMVLHNHSYIHCFFTYRAMIATVMSAVMIVSLITKRRYDRK